jgi:hypothetical protein
MAIEGKGDALILPRTHPSKTRLDYVGLSKLIVQISFPYLQKFDRYMFLVRALIDVGQNKHIQHLRPQA